MKCIHLSDLHLGKRLNGFSMIEDQRHILQQILEIVEEERPDAVLIAGDVYDRPIPSVEAMGLFEEGTALMKQCSQALDKAEQKVAKLISAADGSPVEEPMEEMEL